MRRLRGRKKTRSYGLVLRQDLREGRRARRTAFGALLRDNPSAEQWIDLRRRVQRRKTRQVGRDEQVSAFAALATMVVAGAVVRRAALQQARVKIGQHVHLRGNQAAEQEQHRDFSFLERHRVLIRRNLREPGCSRQVNLSSSVLLSHSLSCSTRVPVRRCFSFFKLRTQANSAAHNSLRLRASGFGRMEEEWPAFLVRRRRSFEPTEPSGAVPFALVHVPSSCPGPGKA